MTIRIDRDTRALTLMNPWAFAITDTADPDPKRVENRSWPAPESLDTFLIHAGRGWDRNAPSTLTLRAADEGNFSAIVAAARINHCCDTTVGDASRGCPCGRWSVPGRYHWVFSEVFVLPQPVSCTGRLRLWRPTPDVLAAVKEQIR